MRTELQFSPVRVVNEPQDSLELIDQHLTTLTNPKNPHSRRTPPSYINNHGRTANVQQPGGRVPVTWYPSSTWI